MLKRLYLRFFRPHSREAIGLTLYTDLINAVMRAERAHADPIDIVRTVDFVLDQIVDQYGLERI